MKKTRVNLTEEECYCTLLELYNTVAKHLDIPVTADTCFDCRCIRVTRSVQDKIWDYYEKEEKYNGEQISMMLLMCGPKANLRVKKEEENSCIAEVYENFAK